MFSGEKVQICRHALFTPSSATSKSFQRIFLVSGPNLLGAKGDGLKIDSMKKVWYESDAKNYTRYQKSF
jgi:hypothetical protein